MPPSDPGPLPVRKNELRAAGWPLDWLSSLAFSGAVSAAQADPPADAANAEPWPAETMRTAIQGCRDSILVHAYAQETDRLAKNECNPQNLQAPTR